MLGHFYFGPKGGQILLTRDTGAFCFLTEKEFQALIQDREEEYRARSQELEEKGFLYHDSQEGYIRRNESILRDAERYLFDATSLFILAVTNACNNRCIYCQANGEKCVQHMSPEVAEQALKQIARSPAAGITIEFQGGEPLMNEKVIRYVVQRGKEILRNKEVQYTIVSNLSLLTEEMAQFCKDEHINVSTSLDGPEFLHNQNRPDIAETGSWAATMRGIERLRKCGIEPGAIETTTAFSLPYAEEIVDTYVNNGLNHLFLRPLTRLGAAARAWDRVGYSPDEFLKFYRKGLERIIAYCMNGKNVTEYHAALFLSKILRGKAVNYMELRSPCGAGLGQLAITANGNVYSCDEGRMMAEAGDEAFRLGNVFEGDYSDWIESPNCKALCSASLLETLQGCCDCVYKPYCGVCPVVNYAINGNITQISKDRCSIYKGILDILFEYIQRKDPKVMNIFNEWSEKT